MAKSAAAATLASYRNGTINPDTKLWATSPDNDLRIALKQLHDGVIEGVEKLRKHGTICGSKGGENEICTCQFSASNQVLDDVTKFIGEYFKGGQN